MYVSRRRRSRDWTWVWLFLLALGGRALFLPRSQVLQTEGTTYVTLARHLLAGRGYVGILGETELVMVSIFPHLMAALGVVIGDLVWAGRILALVSSAALVIPVYLLGRDLFMGRAGLWAGLLVALHPYLLEYAPLVRVEAPFMLAWMWGVYATWKAIRGGPQSRWGLGVALFFALAYLLKSEGAVYFALSVLLLAFIWIRRHPLGISLATLGGMAALFLLFSLPMMGWLSWQTGRLTSDTKGIVNYSIARRIARGMDYHHAAYGLGPEGTPVGPLLDRNRLVRVGIGPTSPDLADPAYREGMVAVLRREVGLLLWPLLGRIWLLMAFIGVVVGLGRGEWGQVLFPLWYLIPAVLGVSTILFVWTRYLLPVIPLVALWAGYGVDALADVFLGGFNVTGRTASRVHAFIGLMLVIILIGTHPYLRPTLGNLMQVHDVEQREAGLWLAQYDPSPSKRIMSTTSQVPYYAAGVHVPMPVDDPALIPLYAQRRGVQYVVISEVKDANRPTKVWLDPQKVPEGWELIYDGGGPGKRIVIYRLSETGCGCEESR